LKKQFPQHPPWDRFSGFLELGIDRFDYLLSMLRSMEAGGRDRPEGTGLEGQASPGTGLGEDKSRVSGAETTSPSVAAIAGKRHIILCADHVQPAKATVLIAHYDRVPGSQGANDNSAAVFVLVEAALRLRETKKDNWVIIFTDGEETGAGGIATQGAYTLAEGLKSTILKKAPVFIFDACGRGDTLIISTTARFLMGQDGTAIPNPDMKKALLNLNYLSLAAARTSGSSRFMLLATPFSDDAGFLRRGCAAQTITTLPQEEAAAFSMLVRRKPDALLDAIRDKQNPLYPATWRLLNSPEDGPETLTPASFEMALRFAIGLVG
jgi:hypothetical protein